MRIEVIFLRQGAKPTANVNLRKFGPKKVRKPICPPKNVNKKQIPFASRQVEVGPESHDGNVSGRHVAQRAQLIRSGVFKTPKTSGPSQISSKSYSSPLKCHLAMIWITLGVLWT